MFFVKKFFRHDVKKINSATKRHLFPYLVSFPSVLYSELPIVSNEIEPQNHCRFIEVQKPDTEEEMKELRGELNLTLKYAET